MNETPPRKPRRGDIWWAVTGAKRRPVLVISDDALNRRLSKVVVIPGTTNLRSWPDELLLPQGVLPVDTAFCCREITTLPVSILVDYTGAVSGPWLQHACGVLGSVLGCPKN